ncbi:4'-phosphopantetheinyl transferase superfamily protein [Arthrobacter sp. PAMC25284]|uniref:4'-phosphopantetheinyl transferase family protein n=1 Tax=Arthrobacter sp. PAMC25284 TaxID=2861279 RepID=UPI0021596EA5
MTIVHWAVAAPPDEAELALLTAAELRRLSRLRMTGDRARFATATVLTKRAVAAELGIEPRSVELDRRCEHCGADHGRPRVPGSGLHLSIAHAGDVAGVAITRAGRIGLDVEPEAGGGVRDVAAQLLGDGERAATPADLLRYWVRKEALVKATGDGIGIGLRDVVVSAPQEPPRLISYLGRHLRARTVDLACRAGYLASVAVLTDHEVLVREEWSTR